MYFIAENGAVIYQGNSLYDYKSFDIQDYQSLVQYLMLEQGLRVYYMWLKSAYILKDTSQPFKENAHFYHQLEEIDSFNVLPDDDYVKLLLISIGQRILRLMKIWLYALSILQV